MEEFLLVLAFHTFFFLSTILPIFNRVLVSISHRLGEKRGLKGQSHRLKFTPLEDACLEHGPQVLRRPATFAALHDWSLKSLCKRFPNWEILVHRYTASGPRKEEMTVRDLADNLMTCNAKTLELPEKLQGELPRAAVEQLREERGEWGEQAALLFIGGGGPLSTTRLHADPAHNVYYQVQGQKRWFLFPPSEAPFLYPVSRGNVAFMTPLGHDQIVHGDVGDHPLASAARGGLVVTLNPGDVLVIPPMWFHAVVNLGQPTDPVVGLAFNSIGLGKAFRAHFGFALTAFGHPRVLWRRWWSGTVDDPLLRSCRTLAQCEMTGRREKTTKAIIPVSVNIFPSRKCNYSCGFCFHTSKTENLASLEDTYRALRMLRDAGMEKLNIAGGEPFLHPRYLAAVCKFAKEELHVAVTLISNGSLIKRTWLQRYGQYVDVLGLSVDSFVERTNQLIGRGTGKHLPHIARVAAWAQEEGIRLKVNTVVNKYNWEEDMNEGIAGLNPVRWKVFQVLVLEGENSGQNGDLRDATKFVISDEQFAAFVERHRQQPTIVPEDNSVMQDSYLLVDEEWRFLACSGGVKRPTDSILDVGVEKALEQAEWDADTFFSRGGVYEWNRPADETCGENEALAW
mmetsp:Transcript_23236/g.65240  ORF Transcript_23236/g.65240 Transcript_23236/m.65240 type:complete len:625 (+) Transcript_23236:81-1955(+)